MPSIDTYRKRAKELVRWHRDRNYSVAEKARLLEHYRAMTDQEVLDAPMPLTLAQEIVAVEAGYRSWDELREGAGRDRSPSARSQGRQALKAAVPIIFVRDVAASTQWYGRLGFKTDFLHGRPPFYGSVSRDSACLHLRLVAQPNFTELARQERSLILASIQVSDVKRLFDEFVDQDVEIAQRLIRQAWGGLDFQVRDPDGNTISFVEYS